MKIVLMHGKDTDPSQKWYPWFAEEMKELGLDFVAPVLPNAHDPSIDEWMSELNQTNPAEDTILLGHSRGGVAILRWLEQLPVNRKVNKVILVATNSGDSEKMNKTENNGGFYTEEGYDFAKIKQHCDNFVILHSRDDQWVPFKAGEENAKGLNAKFLRFEDRGHFGKGVAAIPELMAEVVIEQEFDVKKALILPFNSKQELLIQDRRGHKKPDWGFFGGSIEEGETPLEAVIRETQEELTINLQESDLIYLGISVTDWDGVRIIRYLYLYPTDQKEFDVREGKGGYWFSFDEVREKLEDPDRFDQVVAKIQTYKKF